MANGELLEQLLDLHGLTTFELNERNSFLVEKEPALERSEAIDLDFLSEVDLNHNTRTTVPTYGKETRELYDPLHVPGKQIYMDIPISTVLVHMASELGIYSAKTSPHFRYVDPLDTRFEGGSVAFADRKQSMRKALTASVNADGTLDQVEFTGIYLQELNRTRGLMTTEPEKPSDTVFINIVDKSWRMDGYQLRNAESTQDWARHILAQRYKGTVDVVTIEYDERGANQVQRFPGEANNRAYSNTALVDYAGAIEIAKDMVSGHYLNSNVHVIHLASTEPKDIAGNANLVASTLLFPGVQSYSHYFFNYTQRQFGSYMFNNIDDPENAIARKYRQAQVREDKVWDALVATLGTPEAAEAYLAKLADNEKVKAQPILPRKEAPPAAPGVQRTFEDEANDVYAGMFNP